MASTMQLDVQRRVDTRSSEAICKPAHAATVRFGLAALEQQRLWIKDAAMKCVEGKSILK